MYGTCAKMRVKAENVDALQKVMADQMSGDPIPGYVQSYVLSENDSEDCWLFVDLRGPGQLRQERRRPGAARAVHGYAGAPRGRPRVARRHGHGGLRRAV